MSEQKYTRLFDIIKNSGESTISTKMINLQFPNSKKAHVNAGLKMYQMAR